MDLGRESQVSPGHWYRQDAAELLTVEYDRLGSGGCRDGDFTPVGQTEAEPDRVSGNRRDLWTDRGRGRHGDEKRSASG